jgi:hypothetical protein
MPNDLPDCPRCDACESLELVRSDVRGLRWCACSCCGKETLLDAEGRVLHPPRQTDVNGVPMFEP